MSASRFARSTRFPVAVHILVLLAVRRDEYLPSPWIARSVDTNEVVIRQVLQRLRKAGLVQTRAGAHGGAALARPAARISLLDVYRAVEDQRVLGMHPGCEACPVFEVVEQELGAVLEQAEDALEAKLRAATIEPLRRKALAAIEQRLATTTEAEIEACLAEHMESPAEIEAFKRFLGRFQVPSE